ncbi:hypothetical protein BP6252_00547 [Coleophoma cylindrospora]|uniref:Uncharacterized protein n=1 Tax=Coleophoma cylindrospora TaxID=1849047 RepID=A0A3D8SQC6_9HELO|nr:hypothetical protein BP6252_00547 [Coleophoma cylindrospora]
MQPAPEVNRNSHGAQDGASLQKSDLPPEIMDILWPALQIGGLSGASGTLVGGFAGIIRSNTPVLQVKFHTLELDLTPPIVSRGIVIQAWGGDRVTPREKVSASAIAGGVGGAAGGLLRGRGNILPGAIMFALCGAAGQTLYNRADARQSAPEADGPQQKSLQDSWLNSKWSPMKVLTDNEYEAMLQEKLLRVNADIALIDEKIAVLRDQELAALGKPAGKAPDSNEPVSAKNR